MQAPTPSTAPPPALVLCLPVDDCSPELQALARAAGTTLFPRPVAPDWRAELAALRKRFPGAMLVRVRRADLWLADDALPRLVHAASAARGPLTALFNGDPQLTVASPDTTLATEPVAIDAAVHALGEHRLQPVAASKPAILLLAAGADPAADLELVDCVYVHVPGPIEGLATPADRRERAPAHPLARLRHALNQTGIGPASEWTSAARDQRPVVLHILHGWGGGAERFVRDLARSDADRHHLLLRASGNPGRRRHGEFIELLDARGGPPLRRALLSPPIGAIARRPIIRRKFIGAADWTNPEIVAYLNKLDGGKS